VFLTGVLASAVTYGLGPALFACLVSVLSFNFFFLPPLYTFTIADPEIVIALFSFAIVAVIASNLTARVRAQALSAQRRAKMTEDLYLFSRKLAGVVTLDDLLWATAYQIASMLQLRVVLLLPEGETVTVRAGDVVVQRGTNHLWHNRGTVPCRFAWILLDAQPVEVAGRTLGASWRHDA